jgi:hypothetical protein
VVLYDGSDSYSLHCTAKAINLKVFIEGFYLGGGLMQAVADRNNYPNLCDTITVVLHNANYPYDNIFNSKGTIDIYGNGIFEFPYTVQSNIYYIAILHRNAIETWSKYPILLNSITVNIDLTSP